MAKTVGPLALSTTPLAIVAQTDTPLILVKEDKSVANWPTTQLIRRMPSSGDADEYFGKGEPVAFYPPPGMRIPAGTIVGYVLLPLGTTTGVQTEF